MDFVNTGRSPLGDDVNAFQAWPPCPRLVAQTCMGFAPSPLLGRPLPVPGCLSSIKGLAGGSWGALLKSVFLAVGKDSSSLGSHRLQGCASVNKPSGKVNRAMTGIQAMSVPSQQRTSGTLVHSLRPVMGAGI